MDNTNCSTSIGNSLLREVYLVAQILHHEVQGLKENKNKKTCVHLRRFLKEKRDTGNITFAQSGRRKFHRLTYVRKLRKSEMKKVVGKALKYHVFDFIPLKQISKDRVIHIWTEKFMFTETRTRKHNYT
jgi:hypothetical protein